MNILFDSFSVLVSHWQLISSILLMMLLGQMFIGSALRMIFRNRLTAEEYFALCAAGWMLPLSLASLFWLVWVVFLPAQAGAFLSLFMTAGLTAALFLRARKATMQGAKTILWILVTLFSAFLFLRLAFVSKVIIPLYFDSAQHYLIIKTLIGSIASNEIPSLGSPTGNYYHVGFHLLTAWTVSTLGVDVIHAILILGQIIVAAIPFPIFLVIKQETQSNNAALFAVLLAAFGWYMPAYAANWGKYPALTSLPLLTFVLSMAYLSLRQKDIFSSRRSLGLMAILVSGFLITVLFHSRSLIAFTMFALAWILSIGWERLSKPLRFVSFFGVLIGIILMILFLRTKDVFGLLFDPYWVKGLMVTAVVLVLGIFAQWRYPKLAFASLLTILFFFGGLLVPIHVPGYGGLTLLDRPLVEMILYLPLSLLGGAGLAGLERTLQDVFARWPAKRFWSAGYLGGLFLIPLLINTFANYNFYPADCCSIVGRDDLVAIDWIDKNLPPQARILISSTELKVLATDSPQGAAGSDAGIWITPLTDRATIPFPYQSDFSQQAIFDALCQRGAEYLYVGDTGATFNNGLLSAYPDRYGILLSMPRTKIYQIVGCQGSQ